LPYAVVQPLLGSVADHFGKTRVMNLCLTIVALAALACAAAPNFSVLVAMRVAAGLVAGGLFPVALAIMGDRVAVENRQVAIGRLLAVGLTGNLLGATISGMIGDFFGWRGMFLVFGVFALIVTVVTFVALRGYRKAVSGPFRLATMIAGMRSVFADPRAKICFSSVFVEATFIHGLFPYVALMLLATGETRAAIAGLVIAAFGLGGLFYSMSVSVLVARIRQRQLMLAGGIVAGASLALVAFDFPWQGQVAIFTVMGFGFYLLHGCIHVHVTELSSTARGAATSLHSCMFYIGQAFGPVLYGLAFAHGFPTMTIMGGALAVLGVGIMCAHLLRHRLPAD
jgi:MFS transporter, DHA1 family, inner membrane transport protein